MTAREDAIRALAESADDWGWKGGKPGEITGGEYERALGKYNQLVKYGDRDSPQALNLYKTLEDGAMQWYDSALRGKLGPDWKKKAEYYAGRFGDVDKLSKNNKLRQAFLRGTPGEYGLSWLDEASKISLRFATFEEFGVPREFTGQLFRAMPQPIHGPTFANTTELVDAFKTLSTNDQRETFLNLLPRWTGTMEQAASAAKRLYKRPS